MTAQPPEAGQAEHEDETQKAYADKEGQRYYEEYGPDPCHTRIDPEACRHAGHERQGARQSRPARSMQGCLTLHAETFGCRRLSPSHASDFEAGACSQKKARDVRGAAGSGTARLKDYFRSTILRIALKSPASSA